jgi:hypothetical protein
MFGPASSSERPACGRDEASICQLLSRAAADCPCRRGQASDRGLHTNVEFTCGYWTSDQANRRCPCHRVWPASSALNSSPFSCREYATVGIHVHIKCVQRAGAERLRGHRVPAQERKWWSSLRTAPTRATGPHDGNLSLLGGVTSVEMNWKGCGRKRYMHNGGDSKQELGKTTSELCGTKHHLNTGAPRHRNTNLPHAYLSQEEQHVFTCLCVW